MDKGMGFYCICSENFSGKLCNAQKTEKKLQLIIAALIMIIMVLLLCVVLSVVSKLITINFREPITAV
jgi:Cu/Ag efflux pump CusA